MVMARGQFDDRCDDRRLIHHTKAVIAGAPDTFVVTDMPFGSCSSAATAIEHATRIMKEGRCDAVKIEGGVSMAPIIQGGGRCRGFLSWDISA